MNDLFLTLVNMSITATWAVLAFTILRPLLRKVPKWVNCLLWGVVGLRLCLPFSFESALSLIPSAETIPTNITVSSNPQIDTGVDIVNNVVNPVISNAVAPDPSYSANPLQVVVGIASYIWVIGLILMVLYSVVSFVVLKKKVSASVLYKDNIYYCDDIETPFILGIIKPKIYVPSGLNEQDLEFVLEHEKSHLKRKDHIIKPISFLILSVYWFNPAIWLWYILLCRDIESACDEKVIKNYDVDSKKLYSTALLNCSTNRRMIMACPVAFGEVGVKDRIKSVLNYKKPAFRVILVAVIISLVLAICFMSNPINDKVNRILNEDGYEVFSAKEQNISFYFTSWILTDEMFERDGVYRVRNRDIINDCVIFRFKEVHSHDDMFTLTFDVTYDDVPDDGTIYVVSANQFEGGIELGDEIRVSDPFGEISDDGTYSSYCHSIGPGTEFCFSVPKAWFENRRDNKIVVNFNVLAVVYEKSKPKDNSSSIGIIGGADGPTSIIVSDKNDEKEIKKLQDKYPHFFGLDTENGVTVYVTKLSQDNFECYLASRSKIDPQRIMHFNNFASIEEMKLILSTYNLANEDVTVEPFQHVLSSYIGDDSEYDSTNISLLLGLNSYSDDLGELTHIYGNYYRARIDSKSEFQVYGLYYKDKKAEGYLLVDKIRTIPLQFVVQDETLYYTSEGRLKSVSLNDDFRVTVYANGIYSADQNYAIERIELVQDGKIYCKADRWGETEETQNNRETVYLAIKTDNSTYDEISKNDIPADKTQFDEILSNIKFTLNTDFENILVKNFRIRYTPTGNIEDAIFNVWVYNGTKANEDLWIEGNIIITFDNTAFFNVINEEIVLLSEYNPKENGSMQTIDEIIEKAELSILQTKNIDKTELQPEYYLLTMDEEKYVEYVANSDFGVDYLQEKNGKFVSSSKPDDLTPQSYQLLNKIYFILVPHYKKEGIQSFVFEESESLVSSNYKVLLFDK